MLAIEREVVSADTPTYFESYPKGPLRSVPVGNVCWACSVSQARSTIRVTVSSPSGPSNNISPCCQERMTSALAQLGPPHRSNQSLAIPSNPPIWKVRAKGQPQYSRHNCPSRFPTRNSSLGHRRDKPELRLREMTAYRERYVRLRPLDLTSVVVKNSPRRDLCIRHLSRGYLGASLPSGELTRPPGRWVPPSVLLRGPVRSHMGSISSKHCWI